MKANYSLQARFCAVLLSTVMLGGYMNAQSAQYAQETQLQQAIAQYVASQGKDPLAAARVQALLSALMAAEGQAANSQQVQAAMAAMAIQSAPMNPEPAQTGLLSVPKSHAKNTSSDMMRAAMFGGLAQPDRRAQSNAVQADIGPQSGLSQPGIGPADAQPAKKPGVFRIGVLPPTAQVPQGQSSATSIAESLRNLIVNDLSGPLVQVVPITSQIPVQVEAEIRQKGCDYLLYSAFVQKQKSGAGGFLKRASALAPMMSMIPMAGGIGGAMAGAAASTALGAAGSMSGLIKAKDEVTLTYKLVAPGNDTPVLTNSTKATAQNDGEDIVKTLIDQEAINVLNQLTQKK